MKTLNSTPGKPFNVVRPKWYFTMAMAAVVFLICPAVVNITGVIVWKLDSVHQVGLQVPQIVGNPSQITEENKKAISFNGINDALVIPQIPIKGWNKFTIEVLFKPMIGGSAAPRFVHFEDTNSNRGTFEIRITDNGEWYLDTFLKNGQTNQGLTLIDSSLLHPLNTWYWAALVYDDNTMTSYVNRKKELHGTINFPAIGSGRISLGARLNKVNWFKGCISELRFHPAAIDTSDMQGL